MTLSEYAGRKGISFEALQRERLAYLQCEGYDEAGIEYPTLDAWLARKPSRLSYEPANGGRGIGDYGNG